MKGPLILAINRTRGHLSLGGRMKCLTVCIICILIIICAACQPTQQISRPTPTAESTSSPSATSTIIPTAVPSTTPEPTNEVTHTPTAEAELSCAGGCQPGRICQNNECVGKVWDLIASNDPADYMGDYIYEEVYSDWKHYQPMVDRVAELTAGLSSSYDKARAIADWVKNSKTYNLSNTIANTYEATIIDIFEAREGVCLDAAMLTTAMLRLADIPARIALPASGTWHAYTEAYIDGEWMGIDAVFGGGAAYFTQDITAILYTGRRVPSANLFVTSVELSSDAEERYIQDIGGNEYNVINATYFEQVVIPRSDYGCVYYPITSEYAACKRDDTTGLCTDHTLTFDEDHKAHDYFQFIFISRDKLCDYYHYGQADSSQNLALSVPRNNYWGYYIEHPLQSLSAAVACNDPCWNRAWLKEFGYVKTALPPGEYTIKYWGGNSCVSSEGIKYVACYDFEVNSGETIVIESDMLNKCPEGDPAIFDVLIELLSRSVAGVSIE